MAWTFQTDEKLTPESLARFFVETTQNAEVDRDKTLRLFAEGLLGTPFKDLRQEYIDREVRRRLDKKATEKKAPLPWWRSPKNGLFDSGEKQ